jgi:hypothetical protein
MHFSCRPAIEKHTERRRTNRRKTEREEGREASLAGGGGVEPIPATVKMHGLLSLLVFHGKGIVTAERGQMSRSAQFLG